MLVMKLSKQIGNTTMKMVITALSINGNTVIDYIYNEETGLYHWCGNKRYAGYTAEELESRRV